MFRCGCCVTPETPIQDLLNLLGIPRPYNPPPPQEGVTFDRMPLTALRQRYTGLPGLVKVTQQALAWYASLARASYAPTALFAGQLARALKSTDSLLYRANTTGLVPGFFVVEYEDGIIVVVSGTTSVPQALAYIATHVAALTTSDPFIVNRTWYDAAAAIRDAILDRYDWSSKMAIFIGHSYGGAVAGILQALLPGPPDSYANRLLVTFGSPAFGSASFCVAPGNTAGHCRVDSLSDPVPFLPTWTNWNTVAGQPWQTVLASGTYRHCAQPIILDGDRLRTATVQTQTPAGDFALLLSILSGAFTRASPHSIVSYAEGLLSVNGEGIRQELLEDWQSWPSVATTNLAMFEAGF